MAFGGTPSMLPGAESELSPQTSARSLVKRELGLQGRVFGREKSRPIRYCSRIVRTITMNVLGIWLVPKPV